MNRETTIPEAETSARPAATTRASRNRKKHKTSLILPLFVVSLLIPLVIYLGPIRMSPYRLVLTVMFVPMFLKWASGKAGPIRFADLAMFFMCCWAAIALTKHHGIGPSIQPAGIYMIETFGTYLLARCYIRTPEDFLTTMRWLVGAVLVILPFAMIESFADFKIILKFFKNFGTTYPEVFYPKRWGVWRAQGPFDHPILFGVFCGAACALSFYAVGYGQDIVKRVARTFGVFFTALLAFSSGPLTAMLIQTMAFGWDAMFQGFKNRWWVLLILCVSVFTLLELASGRGAIVLMMQTFAFNAWTAMYRLWIFEYASISVGNNPIWGIGMNEHERPDWVVASVDMYWMIPFMRYGMPAGWAMLLAYLSVFANMVRTKGLDERLQSYRKGVLITMVSFFLAGWTVHYWNATYILFIFIMGCGVWMTEYGEEQPAKRKSRKRSGRTSPHLNAPGPVSPEEPDDPGPTRPARGGGLPPKRGGQAGTGARRPQRNSFSRVNRT